ncbi:MAG: hypothetical protein HKP53_09465 [Eudoraea sp.]|nr:hypothetical protein [Eudoraea sp.]
MVSLINDQIAHHIKPSPILNTCLLVVCSSMLIDAQNRKAVITVFTLSPQAYMVSVKGGNTGIL